MATKIDSLWFKIDDSWIKMSGGGGGGGGTSKFLCVPTSGSIPWSSAGSTRNVTVTFEGPTKGNLVVRTNGQIHDVDYSVVTAEGTTENKVRLDAQEKSITFEAAYAVSVTVSTYYAQYDEVSDYKVFPLE